MLKDNYLSDFLACCVKVVQCVGKIAALLQVSFCAAGFVRLQMCCNLCVGWVRILCQSLSVRIIVGCRERVTYNEQGFVQAGHCCLSSP